MQVQYNVKNPIDSSITISELTHEELDKIRVLLFQIYGYNRSSSTKNPFHLSTLVNHISKEQ